MSAPEGAPPHASLLHRGIGRVELFDYAPDALSGLKEALPGLAAGGYRRRSLHAPMPRPERFTYSGVTCFFLHEEEEKRGLSFRVVRETLELAREWEAEYVVSHLTYGPADSRDPETARRLAREACRELARLSRSHGVPIHIEYAAYTPSFNDPEEFAAVVSEHPELGICVDVGHAFLGAQMHGRSYERDLKILSRHARSVHLWNTKGLDHNRRYGHTPLHPGQTPGEGWIDIAFSLEVLLRERPEAAIIFEYPARSVTAEIQEGYDWVEGMVRGMRKEEQPRRVMP